MYRRPPRSTRTDTPFPSPTLFRSVQRAAGEHRLRGQLVIGGFDAHLFEHVAEGEFRRPVHHHAHRAGLVVLADQRHRAREVGVRERGQRDQQLVGQRCGGCRHGAILPGRHDARAAPQPIPNCSSSGVARRTSTTSTRARNGRPASGWLPSTVTVSASTAVTTTSSGPRSVCAFSLAPTCGSAPESSMLRGRSCTRPSWRLPKPCSGATSTSNLSPAFLPASAYPTPRTLPPVPGR